MYSYHVIIKDRIQFWNPMVPFFPLSSFPKRSFLRLRYLIFHFVSQILLRVGNRLKLTGADAVGENILKLNRNSILGKKGKKLIVPKDDVIYQKIKLSGHWELEECKFLGEGLANLEKKGSNKFALLDLGANTGLVTLGTANLAKTHNDFLLVEPLPKHVEAIVHNLNEIEVTNQRIIFPFALGEKSGELAIYSENSNQGNSSIIKSLVPQNKYTESKITLVQARKFHDENLQHYSGFVLKSDMQGMDAEVLSSFPKTFWEKCDRAVIEIWAIHEIQEDECNLLIDYWSCFDYASWSPKTKEKVSSHDLKEFWLSRTGKERNLFLSMKI